MHLWNVLDFGMLSIFVASFTARFMAFLKASKAQQYVDMHVPDDDLSNASLPDEVAYFTYGKQSIRRNIKVLCLGCYTFFKRLRPDYEFMFVVPFFSSLFDLCSDRCSGYRFNYLKCNEKSVSAVLLS